MAVGCVAINVLSCSLASGESHERYTMVSFPLVDWGLASSLTTLRVPVRSID